MQPVSVPFRRALVTGGAGFIGSHLVDALVGQGVEVIVLDDLSGGSRDNVHRSAKLVESDIAAPGASQLIAEARPELIVHAAAQVSVAVSIADPSHDREVNLAGTQHVLEGGRLGGTSRFVFTSSGGAVYGDTPFADESTLPAPENPYGIHKLAAEGYVRLSGLSFGIVRYSNVYGSRQRAGLEGGVVAKFVDALRGDGFVTIFGDGLQVRDFLYVGDAVEATLTVAGSTKSGTWNVATGQATSVNDLLAVIESLTGVSRSVRSEAARPGDVQSSRLDVRRIAAEFGWRPAYALREGLRATLDQLVDA
jgi:UDP-glucose 4-epimerase